MEALQIIWFILIFVLLTGYAILDGFDLGTGIWHLFTPKKEERDQFIKAIGPFWDGNEVWLLTGGGAIFAAFPPVYATTFSGFYLAMMLVLLALIFRASAIEFRDKIQNEAWIKRWDVAFAFGSTLPTILFGVAVGNIVRGLPMNEVGDYTGGFFALLNPYALLIGLTTFAMFAVHGAAFLSLKTSGELHHKAGGWLKVSWPIYLVLHMIAVVWTLVAYAHTSLAFSWFIGVVAIVAVIAIRLAFNKCKELGVFMASSTAILINMIFVAASIFPMWVPNLTDRTMGLSIYNSSSSELTLGVMLVLALIGMPLVIGYTTYIYRVFKGKVS